MNTKLRIVVALVIGMLVLVVTLLAMKQVPIDTISPALAASAALMTSVPYLVKDIYSGTQSSYPSGLIEASTSLFFVADDGNGTALWKSDGTLTGTALVYRGSPSRMTDVSGTLFFMLYDQTYGYELWKSDGTPTGTFMVKDINPAGSSSPNFLTNLNGVLFFNANENGNFALWTSDGTPTGTVMVKDTNPTSPYGGGPVGMIRVGNMLFFMSSDGIHGGELWKSDGTFTGTVMVQDIDPGPTGSSPSNLIDVNGQLFFLTDDGTHGQEWWKSDGTPTGTVMISETFAGTGPVTVTEVTSINNTLFFIIDWQELWKSDGTPTGTMLIKAFPTMYQSVNSPTNVNGTLFFSAARQLWKSDGTPGGTVMVTENCASSCADMVHDLINAYGRLFFSACNEHGCELWTSDGTLTGTAMVADINPSTDPFLSNFERGVAGGRLFFTPDDGSHGVELWALTVPQDLPNKVYLPIVMRD
jgi:ELWxxDGT repeat protein